jgi:hypothetical protein
MEMCNMIRRRTGTDRVIHTEEEWIALPFLTVDPKPPPHELCPGLQLPLPIPIPLALALSLPLPLSLSLTIALLVALAIPLPLPVPSLGPALGHNVKRCRATRHVRRFLLPQNVVRYLPSSEKPNV